VIFPGPFLQYAFIKTYWLTDFKESAFSANKYFLRMRGNQKEGANVFTVKSVFTGTCERVFGKTFRSLEGNITELLQKHCDVFVKTL
jgi:hypothetical protein